MRLAQYNLGGMYNSGRGVPKDPVRSYMWVALAAESGDATAGGAVAGYARRLSTDDLGKARALTRQWKRARGASGRLSGPATTGCWRQQFY